MDKCNICGKLHDDQDKVGICPECYAKQCRHQPEYMDGFDAVDN